MHPRPLIAVLSLIVPLAACGEHDAAAYPRLLPLSELNRPPAIPAHAADAAADPAAVGAALDARRAKAAALADAARRPVTDADALGQRAAQLRRRAGELAQADLAAAGGAAGGPPGSASTQPTPQPAAAPADSALVDPAPADPATAARADALRERARAMTGQPARAALPNCPPGVRDPAAARCQP